MSARLSKWILFRYHPVTVALGSAIALATLTAMVVMCYAIDSVFLTEHDTDNANWIVFLMVHRPIIATLLGIALGLPAGLMFRRIFRRYMDWTVHCAVTTSSWRTTPGMMWRWVCMLWPFWLAAVVAGALAVTLRLSVVFASAGAFVPIVLSFPESIAQYRKIREKILEGRVYPSAILQRRLVAGLCLYTCVAVLGALPLLFISWRISCEIRRDRYSEWIDAGSLLSEERVAELERRLKSHPGDLEARARLVGYWHGEFLRGIKPNRALEEFRRHVLWVIQNVPESKLAGEAAISPHYPALLERAKDLWLKQADDNPDDVRIFENAARFFWYHDPSFARDMLLRAQRLQPGNPAWADGLAGLDGDEEARSRFFHEP